MNVDQIKAFMGDQKADQKLAVNPNELFKKQLQQDGLHQVAEFSKQLSAQVSVSSNQTTIGLKIFGSSLGQTLELDGKKSQDVKEKNFEEKAVSLFDFENVARNVLKFVGTVIRGAVSSEASDEKLNGLFSQAREGVSRGFAMAEKDLTGFMNEEIKQGVTRSRDIIDSGINDLEADIFGGLSLGTSSLSALNATAASDERSGNVLIRTKDGDEVTLSFESLSSFQASNQLSFTPDNKMNIDSNTDENTEGQTSAAYLRTVQLTTSYEYYEKSGISFSLKGELDEGELNSIADLVGQMQDLADTFFSGDIDKAFEEALSMGFDTKELSGYAMNLNRTSQSEVLKTYEGIQHYHKSKSESSGFGNVVSPISRYLEKMIGTFANAEKSLNNNQDYNALVGALINNMENVQVPDLVTAINRFHSFNQTLLAGLPQPDAE